MGNIAKTTTDNAKSLIGFAAPRKIKLTNAAKRLESLQR